MTVAPTSRKPSGKIRLPLRRRKRRAGERAGLRKEKIIEVATRLFERTDAQGLSIRALAKALGVVPTTVKSHFKGALSEITTAIARAAIVGAAHPYEPRETPADYLGDVFYGILQRLHGRPMVARLVAIELSRDPLLDPSLAERILVCVRELGAEAEYLHRGLSHVIARLVSLLLAESVRSGEAGQRAQAAIMALRIEQLPAGEFPVLTEYATTIVNSVRWLAAPPSPAIAHEHAMATIELLRMEIGQARLPPRQRRRS